MDEKDIEVRVVGDVLTIKGEKHEGRREKARLSSAGAAIGAFERALHMPEGVNADSIQANFKKGVLTITLPKSAEAQKPAKTIEVKGE